jgi:hypothetical protein
MRPVAILFLFAVLASCTAGPGEQQPLTAPYAQDLVALGVDPASPVASRIGDVPADTLKRFKDFGRPGVRNHVPTAAERSKIVAALGYLTPLQERIVQERLRSISVADGLGANAQTTRYPCGACHVFDLIINAQLLNETISQFATRKERTLFDASGSTLSVSIEAGAMDALVFILLHETTHMVDHTIHLTPQTGPGFPIPDHMQTSFSRGIWKAPTEPVAAYRTPLLDSLSFRTGKPLRIEQAQALYQDLKKTPFPSSYAAFSSVEDLPELVALSELTGRLKQPFRIELRDGTRVISSYEPMKSPLVRARLPQLARFNSPAYELPPPIVSPK